MRVRFSKGPLREEDRFSELMIADSKPLRIAAVGDIHYTRTSKGHLHPLFTEASKEADVLLLCGDLTDYGHAEEAPQRRRPGRGIGKEPREHRVW